MCGNPIVFSIFSLFTVIFILPITKSDCSLDCMCVSETLRHPKWCTLNNVSDGAVTMRFCSYLRNYARYIKDYFILLLLGSYRIKYHKYQFFHHFENLVDIICESWQTKQVYDWKLCLDVKRQLILRQSSHYRHRTTLRLYPTWYAPYNTV